MMMRSTILIMAAAVGVAFTVPAPAAGQGNGQKPAQAQAKEKQGKPDHAQGRGQGQKPEAAQARGKGQKPDQARARSDARRGPPGHARAKRNSAPDRASFNRNLMERAVATRDRRGNGKTKVKFERGDDRVRVLAADGDVLFTLDREVADELGYWRVAVVPRFRADAARDRRDDDLDDDDLSIFRAADDDEARAGAPSFCRSGEGHPVWGREWCLDKDFGLGDDDSRWGRIVRPDGVILRRPDPERDVLDQGGLIDILGDIVFGRIAVQSLVLGADEPLTGRWLGEPAGPRVLRIQAGDLAVAELVDADRDDRVDVMVFNLGD